MRYLETKSTSDNKLEFKPCANRCNLSGLNGFDYRYFLGGYFLETEIKLFERLCMRESCKCVSPQNFKTSVLPPGEIFCLKCYNFATVTLANIVSYLQHEIY